jgi:hypothetical protein
MASLVSPNVDVTIKDDSFFPANQPSMVPVIFVATADEKNLADESDAIGTFEHGVVRTVTSKTQALQLYGTPRFLKSADGSPYHGDCRNEQGLDALLKYLEIGNLAYVVRANVNLDDSYTNMVSMWTAKISAASDILSNLVALYISEYNATNGLVPADNGYKRTVTKSEVKTLIDEALVDVLAMYSFSSANFQSDFLQNHTVNHAGFQDALFKNTAGYITSTDQTGLENDDTVYGFELHLVSTGGTGTFTIQVQGEDCQTFGDLIAELEDAIQDASGSSSTVDLIQGRIRITSDLLGATSQVHITSDGFSGIETLFANTNLFDKFDDPVVGAGIHSLDVFNSTFTVVTGSFDGLQSLITNWTSGSITASQFTAQEAEGLLLTAGADFKHTKQFLNETSLGANDAARRVSIVKQLQAVINDPMTGIRSQTYEFTVAVCPGFPEVTDELVRLVQDVKEEAFVIGETPLDRPPTGPNSIAEWATTTDRVTSEHVAYYYPHGLSSNVDGETILTTAASTALRVYAYSDQVSQPYFAPAGPQRGSCPHLTSIGYVSGTLGGPTEFVVDWMDGGTQDALNPHRINPIAFIQSRGILVMEQQTTYGADSALKEVNVSRLAKLIKRTLRKSLFSYLFEPNDKILRDDITATANSYLSTLMGRRGLYDYASLCDESNNTPETIDNGEVWLNVAIKPTRAAKFIHVPVSIVATGANIGGRTISA